MISKRIGAWNSMCCDCCKSQSRPCCEAWSVAYDFETQWRVEQHCGWLDPVVKRGAFLKMFCETQWRNMLLNSLVGATTFQQKTNERYLDRSSWTRSLVATPLLCYYDTP